MNHAETIPPEPRWPAVLGVLAMSGLFLSLPEDLSPGPGWLAPAVMVVLVIPSVLAHRAGRHRINHVFGIVLSAVMTLVLVWSLVRLITVLLAKKEMPSALLLAAGALWLANILVFASWYWRLDAGGPHVRDSRRSHVEGAFLFPQMSLPGNKAWRPGFVDYLALAFNTSTAFSPADVAPLGAWAKLLMMLQSLVSLMTLALVAARAVNIL